MQPKTRSSLLLLNGALLLILISPMFRALSGIVYYSMIFIGMAVAAIAASSYFKNRKQEKKDDQPK